MSQETAPTIAPAGEQAVPARDDEEWQGSFGDIYRDYRRQTLSIDEALQLTFLDVQAIVMGKVLVPPASLGR